MRYFLIGFSVTAAAILAAVLWRYVKAASTPEGLRNVEPLEDERGSVG